MNGWLWLLLISALLALLLTTRLKITGRFGADGGSLTVGFGLLTILTVPGQPKPEKRGKPKPKTEQKKKPEKPDTAGGSVPAFRELVSIISTLLGKLKRRLCVDELTLWYLSAAEDPASAALAFGGANAAAGLLLQLLERIFRIKEKDVRTGVSFTETKPTVYAVLRLSLSLYSILHLGGMALILFWKARKRASDTEV